MLVFLWGFITVVFGIIYLFQMMGIPLIGLEIVAILLLFLSFRESKRGRYGRIIGMNVIMVFVSFIVYISQHTFDYIHPGDTEKMLVMLVAFILAEAMGIFWGKQFYREEHKKTKTEPIKTEYIKKS